jgi:aspartyl-tRNA(Asn)/glutamyl-tRNA(Gln) amidotransferase subunit A
VSEEAQLVQPHELSIAEAADAIARRQLSSVELAGSVLARIEELNDTYRAFIGLRPDADVLAEARRLDELPSAQAEGMPLRGIPIGLKANYSCAGLATSAGSRILENWVPDEDAEAVRRLRAAGAVVVGMTNMNEFANGPTGFNSHYGSAANPWDAARMPGGSSSGSAVALALDMCLGATGSDTGGSIRTPSAFCGTVGLKPTRHLVSKAGVFPFSDTLDHAGPMARTADDASLLLTVMRDSTAPASSESVAARPDSPFAGMTIGVETAYFTAVLEDSVRACFNDAVRWLEENGATVRELTLDAVEDSLSTLTAILFPEAALVHERWLTERPHDYVDEVRESLLSGRGYSAIDYVAARRKRSTIRQELDRAFDGVDVLATPTTIMRAPRWDSSSFEVAGTTVDPLNAFIRCTAPFNLSGHPAVSVPCGATRDGMPVGIQLVAPHSADAQLLELASVFQHRATGGRLGPALADAGAPRPTQ